MKNYTNTAENNQKILKDGFNENSFESLEIMEPGHFWFEARNKIIIWGIQKYFPNIKKFMEIGCGTGFVLSKIIESFPNTDCIGTELYKTGLQIAKKRIPEERLIQMDARHIKYTEEYDLIGAFDVLEHIYEDENVLKNIHKALKKNAGVILTVPQHNWLWSEVDNMAHHVRRYTKNEINQKLINAGFKILDTCSFVSLLLPIMLISRYRMKKFNNFDPMQEFKINPVVNKFLKSILLFEHSIHKKGIRFPAGGSLLVVAQKK